MKWSTAASIGLFAASAALFGYSVMVMNNNLDLNGPEITMDTDTIQVSIRDDDQTILSGITAVDSRDGDVTDSLVVESLSNFIGKNTRKASIVAFDKDNHIARTTREIEYTDYHSPRFVLDEPLRFPFNSYDYTSIVKVEDCIDGDISNKLHMSYGEEYVYGNETMKVVYSISNSMGDTVELPVTLSFYESGLESLKPSITLSDYLIYVTPGTKVDPMDYLEQVAISGRTFKKRDGKLIQQGSASSADGPVELDSELLTIDNPVSDLPGVYEICYTLTDPKDEEDSSDDTEKTIRLIVVVTEE